MNIGKNKIMNMNRKSKIRREQPIELLPFAATRPNLSARDPIAYAAAVKALG